MITFDRRQGAIFNDRGAVISTGIWSGHGAAHNDITREQEHAVGPLPAGVYHMGKPRDGGHLGPFVIDLEPLQGTNMYGRSLMRIHGDNGKGDFSASDGCVIAPRPIRERCSNEPDHLLKVV